MRPVPLKSLIESDFNADIVKICHSWQDVVPGSIFVAIKGAKFDGHDFLDQAAEKGAVLMIISDKAKAGKHKVKVVENTRKVLSNLAARFYSEPARNMEIVGITGTNGKTTTNWMVYHMLYALGAGAARLGTFGFESKVGSKIVTREGNLTTPDALGIHKDLAEAFEAGARSAVLEVSSHALDQARADDLHLNAAIYTNLTRDHLDYHKDMEAYFSAKAKIFHLLSESEKNKKTAVVNLDCEFGKAMLDEVVKLNLDYLTYGRHSESRIQIDNFSQDFSGSVVSLNILGEPCELKSKFIGMHNAENSAAAIGACLALGYNLKEVLEAYQKVPQVPGRLESVGTEEVGVFVDYAHTPDALQNVLKALRPLVKNRLWVVFGCGGDRDRGKRPIMARISSELADKVVVTSDNPRTENADSIIEDILSSGIEYEFKEVDRKKAISRTIKALEKGDVVLIAGKGHENYQIVGTEKRHFSDVEEVARAFEK